MSSEMYEPHRRLIGGLLRAPHQAVVREIHKGVVAAGYSDIRKAHLVVFQHIAREGSRSSDLAERANMTKQSMGYLVDYLEERGYVERAPDRDDGRARVVRLTARGWDVMRVARRVTENLEAEWGRYLGEERMSQLIHLLQDLVAMLGEPTTF